jgi:hypothetical protein
MESPRQFMERYLREKEKVVQEASRLKEMFYAPDYLRLYLERRSRHSWQPN